MDLASQAQTFLNLYWEDILFAVGVGGTLAISRELKNARKKQPKPGMSPAQAQLQPGSHVSTQADMHSPAAEGVFPTGLLTKAEDDELNRAIPPELPMALPTSVPTQVSTKADTQAPAATWKTEVRDPTPTERKQIAKSLALLLGGGS